MQSTSPSYPTVIDLFSGCGGVSLGFKQAGFDVRVAVELDDVAVETYDANRELLGNVTVLHRDIRYLSAAKILETAKLKKGECTVVTGCAPCQGFSKHRKSGELSKQDKEKNISLAKKAKTDKRNRLFLKLIKLIIEISPNYYLIENVPELKEGVGEPLYNEACQMLETAGYSVNSEVIQCFKYGIPQNRRRLVMIGCKTSLNKPELTLPPITHENPAKIKTAQDKVNRCVKANRPLTRLSKATVELARLEPWKTVRQTIATYPEITAGQTHPTMQNHVAVSMGETNLERLKYTSPDGGSRLEWPEHLKLECHKTHKGHIDVYGRMRWDTPSPTITGGFSNISKGRFAHPVQNRGMSLREGAAFQTFPDNFQFMGTLGQITLQIGNAVPVKLARIMAEHIYCHYRKLPQSETLNIRPQEMVAMTTTTVSQESEVFGTNELPQNTDTIHTPDTTDIPVVWVGIPIEKNPTTVREKVLPDREKIKVAMLATAGTPSLDGS